LGYPAVTRTARSGIVVGLLNLRSEHPQNRATLDRRPVRPFNARQSAGRGCCQFEDGPGQNQFGQPVSLNDFVADVDQPAAKANGKVTVAQFGNKDR